MSCNHAWWLVPYAISLPGTAVRYRASRVSGWQGPMRCLSTESSLSQATRYPVSQLCIALGCSGSRPLTLNPPHSTHSILNPQPALNP
eukprot:3121988-Rhodomonas_salina.2